MFHFLTDSCSQITDVKFYDTEVKKNDIYWLNNLINFIVLINI